MVKKTQKKKVRRLPFVMSGEASLLCQVERRTFLRKAEKYGVSPKEYVAGRALYDRDEVLSLAKKIKLEQDKRRSDD